jgi:hypothetical protein
MDIRTWFWLEGVVGAANLERMVYVTLDTEALLGRSLDFFVVDDVFGRESEPKHTSHRTVRTGSDIKGKFGRSVGPRDKWGKLK